MDIIKPANEALTYAYVVVGACCMSCCRQQDCQRYVFVCVAHHRNCYALLAHAESGLSEQTCKEAAKFDVVCTLQLDRDRSPQNLQSEQQASSKFD